MSFSKDLFKIDMSTSPVVQREQFEEATVLFEEDNFNNSVLVLEAALKNSGAMNDCTGVPISQALFLLGRNWIALRDFPALDHLEEAVALLGLKEMPEFELVHVLILGIKGKNQEVIAETSTFISRANPPAHLLPEFLLLRGRNLALAGEAKQSEIDCETAYAFFNFQDNKIGAGRAAIGLAFHLFTCGKYKNALAWFLRADEIFKQLNLPNKIAFTCLNMGVTHYKLGELDKSLTLLKESLRLGTKGNWSNRQCFIHISLGNVYRMLRDFDLAHHHLTIGHNLAKEMSMAREEAIALEFLGDLLRDQGYYSDALNLYKKTLSITEPLAPEGDIIAEAHRRIGECHVRNNDHDLATKSLAKALRLTQRLGDRFEEAVTLRIMAESAQETGHTALALNNITTACTILENIDANYELAISRFKHAGILLTSASEHVNNHHVLPQLNQAWHSISASIKYFSGMDSSWWLAQANRVLKQVSTRLNQQKKEDSRIRSDQANQQNFKKNSIIYKSKAMHDVLSLCDIYAASNSPLLIHGETGTGKELIAHRLHAKSGRPGKLVSVNVASISPLLFEREFFGHIKGAFTGADETRQGFAEQAHMGTLFLDEIGELPLDLQPKLLRLLQEGKFHAVGDSNERSVDIRLISATNKDLRNAAEGNLFRQDFFYRLQVLLLNIPPLKNRRDDISLLMQHFLSVAAGRIVEINEYLNPASIELAENYDWPGNVREIIAVCQQLHIQMTALGQSRVELVSSHRDVLTGPGNGAIRTGTEVTVRSPRQCMVQALQQAAGNRTEAAQILQISRSTLYRQIKEFGL